MFGYIMPDKAELKIKEYELFRAYYCGVCKSMGRSFGPLSRLALNYESVFVGLLISAAHKEKSELNREACVANPFKKKLVVKNNRFVDLAADINVILTYYKLLDNWEDEKHLPSFAGKLLFSLGNSKAFKRSNEAGLIIKNALKKQSELEKAGCSSIDAAAEPTAEMIRDIILSGCKDADESIQRGMAWIGYNIGKWIYTIDAYDDIEKDIKSGSYNPLLLQYKYEQQGVQKFKEEVKQDTERDLTYTLSQAAKTVELLDIGNKSIIENIVYLGMNSKTNKVLCNDCGQCKQEISEGVGNYEKSI